MILDLSSGGQPLRRLRLTQDISGKECVGKGCGHVGNIPDKEYLCKVPVVQETKGARGIDDIRPVWLKAEQTEQEGKDEEKRAESALPGFYPDKNGCH